MARQSPPIRAAVLLESDRYRFVEVWRENEHGIAEAEFVVEVMDGADALGQPRWIDANKRDALSTYAGAMNWLKLEFARHLSSAKE